jgi:hypothetical protein
MRVRLNTKMMADAHTELVKSIPAAKVETEIFMKLFAHHVFIPYSFWLRNIIPTNLLQKNREII